MGDDLFSSKPRQPLEGTSRDKSDEMSFRMTEQRALSLSGVEGSMPDFAPALRAQYALSDLISSEVTNVEIFRVVTDPRYRSMILLDVYALPNDEEPKNISGPYLMVLVDRNEQACNELIAILERLDSKGVATRDKFPIEEGASRFPCQEKKFSFAGYPILFGELKFH